MRIAVLFENQLRATWASHALLGSGTLAPSDAVTLHPGAAAPSTERDDRTLGAVVVVGLGCAILMTFALEGLTLLALVTATALALAWGALYGVLASTLSTAVASPVDRGESASARAIVLVESESPESISRARRYLLSCAGAVAARTG